MMQHDSQDIPTNTDQLVQLQLLNLNFLMMRQVSDSFRCNALREAERELILKRLYQMQTCPSVQSCKSSLKMLNHLQKHWQAHCDQYLHRPALKHLH